MVPNSNSAQKPVTIHASSSLHHPHLPHHHNHDVVVSIRERTPAAKPDSITGADEDLNSLNFRGSPNMLRAEEIKDLEADINSSATPSLQMTSSSSLARTRPRSKSFDSSLPLCSSLDPPSRLIESFLQRQAASGNLCLDMDMAMMDKLPSVPLSTVQEDNKNDAKGANVIVDHTPSAPFHAAAQQQQQHDVVMQEEKGSTNNMSSIQTDAQLHSSPSSSDLETEAKRSSGGRSRLSDRRSTGQLRTGQKTSALTGGGAKSEEEDDESLKDEDVPESLRKPKCSAMAVVQWVAFVIIMGALVCSLVVPVMARQSLCSMALWKWSLLVLLLFCGRLVSGWVISLVVMIIERNFLLRKRVLYFVYALRKGMQNCIWLTLAMAAWKFVFDQKVQSAVHSGGVLSYVTKLLNCFLVSALLWLIKVFLVKVMASSFHVSTYFERIQESLFGQWLLETLSGPATMSGDEQKLLEEEKKLLEEVKKLPESSLVNEENKNNRKKSSYINSSGMMGNKSGLMVGGNKSGVLSAVPPLKRSHQLVADNEEEAGAKEGITIDHLHRLNTDNVSAWNMKRLINFVRYGGIYTLSSVIDQTTAASSSSEQDMEIQNAQQAKAAAKKIFLNVAKPGARYIERHDLLRFMREKDVEKALPLFEGAVESGTISKAALKNFAVHVVRERRALAASLNDTKTAVKKLQRIIDVIVGVVILIICLLILGITTSHLLVVISSQLVLVAFIFGNTCKTIFEDIIFLFVMHPFDVGDRCIVDGMQLVVDEMNILSTVFVKGDNERLWYPNSVLATKYIFNYSRTPDTRDYFDFCIDACTPSEKIVQLKERISKYLASKPNHWTKDHHLLVKGIENKNKMNVQLKVNHTINFTDDSERQNRKSNLILDVNNILQELEIGYGLPPQEVHLSYSQKPAEKEL